MVLFKYISPSLRGRVKIVYHWFYRLLHRKSKIKTDRKYVCFDKKHCDTFFGYYDVSPFDGYGNIIYNELSSDRKEIKIVLNNENNTNKRYIASSHAWNWQQGCRLRWFPSNENTISFNDFNGGHYYNRILNIETTKEKIIDWPLYDINKDGTIGISLDFGRLGVLRPGYGYTCESYVVDNLCENGIFVIDLKSNTKISTITYKDIADSLGNTTTDFSDFYINHLSFSPSGKLFLFFWINKMGGYHQASLLVYNLETRTIIPIETEEKVSHYDWIDDDSILCTTFDKNKQCRYCIYSLDGSKLIICNNILRFDGHPSLLGNNTFITDTYPNRQGYQELMFVDRDSQTKHVILEVYSKPTFNVETRTDLHPRLSEQNRLVCIDCNSTGYRNLLLVHL